MKKVNTNFLNGTRFLLALWVAIGHFYKYIGGTEFIKIPVFSRILLNNGPAVDGFMVITGFLMMYHYLLRLEKEPSNQISTFVKFWYRRIFRLYPLYLVTVIVAFCLYKFNFALIYENYHYFTNKDGVFKTTYSPTEVPSLFDLLAHLTFIHGFIPDVNTSILGPAWSLSLEMQFYFLFPFIFLLLFRKNKLSNIMFILLTIGSLAASIVIPKLLGTWDVPGSLANLEAPAILPYKLHFFVLGMIMASVVLKKLDWKHLIFWLIITIPFQGLFTKATVVFIVFFMFSPTYEKFLPKIVMNIINFFKSLLSNKLSQFGADVSYSLYLIHMIILPYAVKLAISIVSGNKLIAAVVSLTIFITLNLLISYLLFKVLELPANAWGKRLISKKFLYKNNSIVKKGA
ncbi:acyltransferase [Bacillus sp. ISL-46]|uniref:acyltransferase family protein n=1 Tax=Bacillus sp. ISL-46 TaxID=2819129 RepID=UPI001BEC670F|nr:acyltransferase [Bacillus sp. ISL-46]MBT2722326.1 acyltransferase [Bacillus sp. ISL-46]